MNNDGQLLPGGAHENGRQPFEDEAAAGGVRLGVDPEVVPVAPAHMGTLGGLCPSGAGF